jgi:SPP1 family predicted phage head-tail adaptor
MKCCDLYAGLLDKKISIQRESRTPDGAGGYLLSWVDFASARAYIKPLSGREAVQAERIQASVTHRFAMRYKAGILPSDRIVYAGRVFNIRAVINVEERNRWLEIVADEGVAT